MDKRSKNFGFVVFKHESRDSNGNAHPVARGAILQPFGRHLSLIEPPQFVSFEVYDE
jgi:hypothetical protein